MLFGGLDKTGTYLAVSKRNIGILRPKFVATGPESCSDQVNRLSLPKESKKLIKAQYQLMEHEDDHK